MPIFDFMGDASNSCVRCRGRAVVARNGVPYCAQCNSIRDWANVIAIVQDAADQEHASPTEVATSLPVGAMVGAGGASSSTSHERARFDTPAATTGPGPNIGSSSRSPGAEADPFAQKLH